MSGPLDQRTRGRTSPHRLRALDTYLLHAEQALLRRADGPWADAAFVDVGFGDSPATTLESARALRALNPSLPVIGVELDASRAEAVAAHSEARTHFRQGGFDLPLLPGETVRVIRAMNLLRQYPANAVPAIHERLGAQVLPGGLVIEGSADTEGAITVAHLLRRSPEALHREALLFHTDFRHGFAPVLFRDWLPRDLRRRVHPGEAIHAFFSAWMASWDEARAEGHREPRASFHHSILRLAPRWEGIETDSALLEQGYLLFRPPGGVFR
ncbi:methylase [Myxococcaceae bacterium GXIMD 01537]